VLVSLDLELLHLGPRSKRLAHALRDAGGACVPYATLVEHVWPGRAADPRSIHNLRVLACGLNEAAADIGLAACLVSTRRCFGLAWTPTPPCP
jgi:hypothetical protein